MRERWYPGTCAGSDAARECRRGGPSRAAKVSWRPRGPAGWIAKRRLHWSLNEATLAPAAVQWSAVVPFTFLAPIESS